MLSLRTKYYLVLRKRRTIFFCHHGDQSSVLVCLLSWRWLNTVNCGNDTMKWTSLLALSLWSSEDCSGGFLWKREFHLFSEVKEKVVADLLFKVTSTVIAPFTIVLRVFYEINYPFLTDGKKKKNFQNYDCRTILVYSMAVNWELRSWCLFRESYHLVAWCYFSQRLSKNNRDSLWKKKIQFGLERTLEDKLVEYSCRIDLCFLHKLDSVFCLLKILLIESHFKGQKLFMDILKKHISIEKWTDQTYSIVLPS